MSDDEGPFVRRQPRARERRARRRVGIVLAALVSSALIGGLFYALMPKPVSAVVTSVERGSLRATIRESARTRIRARYVIKAPVTGTIERIALEPGTRVSTSELIAKLAATAAPILDVRARRSAELHVEAARASLMKAAAELRRAEIRLELTRKERERARRLARESAVTPAELDQAEAAHLDASKLVESASMSARICEAELRIAESTVRVPEGANTPENVFIRAPIGGTILSVFERGPCVVFAGTPLVEVGEPSELELVASVLTTDALQVANYPAVRVDVRGYPSSMAGLRRVEPAAYTKLSALGVEEQRVDVLLDWTPPESVTHLLGDGYRVEVTFTSFAADDVVSAPTSAIFRRGDGWAAYAVEDERARLKTVTLGARGDRHVEVLSGLAPGDEVVAYPSEQIADGVSVERIEVER